MKDPRPSKLSHKHVFLSIQRYDFLNWLTSLHYSKLSPGAQSAYKQPSSMYLTAFDFYDVLKLKKVSKST